MLRDVRDRLPFRLRKHLVDEPAFDIQTIGELRRLKDDDLLCLPGVGLATLVQLHEFIGWRKKSPLAALNGG
jgi:hypothetical protein